MTEASIKLFGERYSSGRFIEIKLEIKLNSTFTSVMAFEVDSNFTVAELIRYLEKKQDFVKFSTSQVLRFNGRVLSPDSEKTLIQLGIKNGSILTHTRTPLIKRRVGLFSFGL